RVAIHARLRWWNAGKCRVFNRGVTVAAIDTVAGDMALVAELDGLFARDAGLGYPGRTADGRRQHEQARDDENRTENAETRNGVGASMKDLRHRRGASSSLPF